MAFLSILKKYNEGILGVNFMTCFWFVLQSVILWRLDDNTTSSKHFYYLYFLFLIEISLLNKSNSFHYQPS
jgi:hypothetical protein